MDSQRLRADDSAVSPVIGTILIVAITVILAAVAGTYFISVGEQTQQTTPQASFEFDYDADPSASGPLVDGSNGGELTIRHDGGDTLPADRTVIRDEDGNEISAPFASDVTAGAVITIHMDQDDTVRITYTATQNTDSTSAVIASYEET
jgi:flagellin-like protein